MWRIICLILVILSNGVQTANGGKNQLLCDLWRAECIIITVPDSNHFPLHNAQSRIYILLHNRQQPVMETSTRTRKHAVRDASTIKEHAHPLNIRARAHQFNIGPADLLTSES